MSNQSIDITTEILIKFREEMAEFRADVNKRFDRIDERFARIEEMQRKMRRNSAGMLVLMQSTAGDFDERVSEVEARVAVLEARGL